MPQNTIQVHPADNVAIAVRRLAAGEPVWPGVTANMEIPQGHKAALKAMAEGEAVIRYGVCLGYLLHAVKAGDWIAEHDLRPAQAPDLEQLTFGTNLKRPEDLPEPLCHTFWGYPAADGRAGTRNLLGIVTTVQCAAGVAQQAAERIRTQLLPRYPHVEDVVVLVPPYGCGVAIDAPEAKIPIRTIRGLIHHPNFGGEALVVSLGCEKLTPERVMDPEEICEENFVVLQKCRGYEAMLEAICSRAEQKLQRLEQRRREELPLGMLSVGLQCGGSDAFPA